MANNNNGRSKPAGTRVTNTALMKRFRALESYVVSRAAMSQALGLTFDGDRDVYAALGYKKDLLFNDYLLRFKRQDIARTIIDAPVNESWRNPPTVSETETKDTETKFEIQWQELAKNVKVWNYFSRVDKLASLGTFAILLLGFDDHSDPSVPVTTARKLLYVFPYSEANVTINEYETDTTNERYSLPKFYSITNKTIQGASPAQGTLAKVHWSRVIHVAEDVLDENARGIPRLERVFNRLVDLERVVGGSSEMFWRGAAPRTIFEKDPEYTFDPNELDDMEDQIEDFIHGLKSYLKTQGVKTNVLQTQVESPKEHVDVQMDLISAASRIPKRILLGSERGELSSSQDEINWMKDIETRQRNYCGPSIIQPFIDRNIEVGVLPAPSKGYQLEWPDLLSPSLEQKAKIGELRAKALNQYVNAIGSDMIVPPELALKLLLAMNETDVKKAMELAVELEQVANGTGDDDGV